MISVIIPCYKEKNIQEKITATLKSAFNAKVITFVISYADKQPNVHHVQTVRSQIGRAIQLNKGIKHSPGNVLVFLHADTTLPDKWDKFILDKVKSGFVCGGFLKQFDSSNIWVRGNQIGTNLLARCGFFLGDNAMWCTRKEMFHIGGFENVPILEDVLMAREFRKRKWTTIKSPVVTSARRFLKWGPLRTIYKMQRVRFMYMFGVDLHKIDTYYRGEK